MKIRITTQKKFNSSSIAITICFMIIYSLFIVGFNQTSIQADDVQTTNVAIEESSVKTTTKVSLTKPKIEVKKRYEKHVKISWKKVENAKYYIVYRAKKNKYIKIKETKKTSFVDKKAKKRKTYKYKVAAAAKVSGVEYKSKDSNVEKVYVRPKKPLTVICGECFVEGMGLYAKSHVPNNYRLVYKVGISTYGLLNTNYINYKGMTLTAVERIAYYRPDRVIFLDGMNEAGNWNTNSTINNYKKMIQLLKKANPNVEIVLLALPPVAANHVSGFAGNKNINHYNKAYKYLADHTENVYYYSGYRKLITDKNGYLKSYANGGDGGHWSYQATVDVVNDIKKYSNKLTKGK